ncbi:MAG: hypothetical protein R2755_26570 [Acidimicrobiales bacterium]
MSVIDSVDYGRWIADHNPLPVIAWHGGGDGFDVRSSYVETYWLPIVGPSAIVAARRLADRLEDRPSGMVVELEELAGSLGLGRGVARHSPVVRTLERLAMFGLARIGWDAYALCATVPPLPGPSPPPLVRHARPPPRRRSCAARRPPGPGHRRRRPVSARTAASGSPEVVQVSTAAVRLGR